MGTVVALWLKRAKRGPMDAVMTAELVAGRGLRGNANQGGRRQVTIIDQAVWEAARRTLGPDVHPAMRRANVMLCGIDLRAARGHILRLGNCRIRILGEVTPCERMEEAHAGLRAFLRPEWRGGVFGEVLDDGFVSVGEEAAVES